MNVTLDQVANFQNGGAWKESEYVDVGLVVVRITNCVNGTVDLSDVKYLSPTSFERYKRHSLETGDLVVATVGSHPSQPASAVGKAIIIPKEANGALLNQNAVCIRPLDNRLSKNFLRYIGQSKLFRDYILSCARGAANQVRMPIGLLKQFRFDLPPLKTQDRISGILSAYDDLIGNCQRRIKILEEMARALYREWFVNFRFPGHEKIKLVPSPLGPIPQCWEICALGDLVKF